MIQMQSQRNWEADERRPLPIFTFSICNLQSTIFNLVMSTDAEVQASDIKMHTAVTTVGRSVRTIARCVVTAVAPNRNRESRCSGPVMPCPVIPCPP